MPTPPLQDSLLVPPMPNGLIVAEQGPATQADRVLGALKVRTRPGLKPSNAAASRCVLVALAHFVMSPQAGEQAPAHIDTVPIDEKLTGEELEEELTRIAHSLVQEAISHAASYPGPQAFGIIMYGRGDVVLQQIRFTAGPTTRSMVGGETEPANIYGISAQQMRHTEITLRMCMETTGQVLDMFREENERIRSNETQLRAELAAMRVKSLETFDLIEALRDGKAKRDQELEAQRDMDARGARIFDMVEKKIVPAVLEKYDGGSGVKRFLAKVASLKPEQLFQIMGALEKDQLEAFGALLPDEKKAELEAWGMAQDAPGASANGKAS